MERRAELSQSISDAIGAGATGVLLEDDEGTGGAQLYEAAVVMKDVLRGRAALLIQDRTDIVAAAEADGVVLSSQGVPTVVARRSLPDGANLVGRRVTSGPEALQAATDGASLVILETGGGRAVAEAATIREAKTQQGGNVPVIAALSKQEPVSNEDALSLVEAGADGVALYHDRLNQTAASFSGRTASEASHPVRDILQSFPGVAPVNSIVGLDSSTVEDAGVDTLLRDGLRHVMDESKESLFEVERQFVSSVIELLEEVVPSLEEVGLLRDALKQLDQPFLMVVVGEFNSGKSTVINALLGKRFLAEGILPTTNEISVLKFRGEEGPGEQERMEDGYMVRYLPAALLRDLNIVDTPGTNVILERQQRLTEEYVPRADMVLFTMSADRPFTDSEVRFLKYIRQWGKKVVFLVNKVDILSGSNEVDEVAQFVSDNARRVLGVDAAKVLPVSARAALQAKLDATHSTNGFFGGGSPLETLDEEMLARSNQWSDSRFGDLERFMVDFLVGGAAAGESLRLKLQTPLFVADALLEAARQQLSSELSTAQQEAEAVASVHAQLAAFRREMEADGTAQRAECRRLVATAVRRAKELVDNVLQLSNREALSAYVFGGSSDTRKLPVTRGFEAEVVGETADSLRTIVSEHQGWVNSNCERQISSYRSFAEARAQQLGTSLAELVSGQDSTAAAHTSDEEDRRRWREQREAEAADAAGAGAQEVDRASEGSVGAGGESSKDTKSGEDTAVAALMRFEPKAAALVLEEEIREAVLGSITSAIGAGAVGVVLTWILPNTLEDVLAIVLAGLAGYVALLNLPLRRGEAKAKLERVANNFIKEVEERLKAELESSLDACAVEVNGFIKPLEVATLAVVERIKDAESRRAALAAQLEQLKQRAANIE
ncbi:probable transmembrane GTPase FZO-like, chloroplastic [Coccomyxa sp. Obi]|nr:probable transmembrane GTPase FZO-like, chloroplastic [Coccomyxa sp. Obi]